MILSEVNKEASGNAIRAIQRLMCGFLAYEMSVAVKPPTVTNPATMTAAFTAVATEG